jgi:hypothetical protein
LHVSDIRVTTADVTRLSYGGASDPALFLMSTSMDLLHRSASWTTVAKLTVILHAVGRRFERSDQSDISDAAILRDLAVLVPALSGLEQKAEGEAFNVPTQFGAWRGVISSLATVLAGLLCGPPRTAESTSTQRA